MDPDLFENLLYSSESDSLDFKQQMYPFSNASIENKSELLKDVLAFSNSWRRTDAFILIGVKEIKGKRGEILGISEHLEDASIQQFVNSKVQRPINFAYISYEYENKQIGIIHIPVQKRPFYLLKDNGPLKKNTVYIRRGSSTDIASLDEIARMGNPLNIHEKCIEYKCEFFEPSKHILLGNSISIQSEYLLIPNEISDFNYHSREPFDLSSPNKNFFRNLYKYFQYKLMINPFSLYIKNTGTDTSFNTKIKIKLDSEDIVIFTKSQLPTFPKMYNNPITDISLPIINNLHSQISISHIENTKFLVIDIGNIQPKDELWFDEAIYIGSKKPTTYSCDITIFADNLPNPKIIPIKLDFLSNQVDYSQENLMNMYRDVLSNKKKFFDDYA